MNFTISALNAFRNADLGGANAIANLGEGNAIVKKNDYHGPLGKIFRAGSTKASNNAVRTELLRSLGKAFELEGMGENDKGVTTFSKDFMDKLAKLLGPAFKREDFGVGADGTVSSGKPLTQRRIEAIVSKAIKAGGELDVVAYGKKLAVIQKEIAGEGKNSIQFFEDVKRALDFYKNEIDRVIVKNDKYNPNAGKVGDDSFLFDDEEELENERSPYLMFDYEKGHYVPLKRGTQLRDHLNSSSIDANPLKMFLHLENAFTSPFDTSINNDEEFDRLKGYMKEAVRTFVQFSIDCYFAAKGDTKAMRAFKALLSRHDPCLDGRTTELTTFAMKHLPSMDMLMGGTEPNAAKSASKAAGAEDEIKIAPDKMPDHTTKTRLDDCIYQEIYAVKDAVPNAKGWEDIAGAIKKRMVGLKRPIAVLNEKTGAIEPLKKDGEAVVRAVTAEDIDRIGPACCDITMIFA